MHTHYSKWVQLDECSCRSGSGWLYEEWYCTEQLFHPLVYRFLMHTHTCTRSMLPLSSFYLSCRLTAFCAWDSSPVSWSPLSADEVLAEMCAAQWVTLHNIYRPFFSPFWRCSSLQSQYTSFWCNNSFCSMLQAENTVGSGNKIAGWLGNTGKLSASPTLTVVYHNYTHIHRTVLSITYTHSCLS